MGKKDSVESIYDLRESEVSIEKKVWDDELVQRLVRKQILMFEKSINYWTPLLERGRDCFEKYSGKILSDSQIETYEEVEDKIVIQPPIMKSPIRALVGQSIRGRKSGQITAEGGSIDVPAPSAEEISSVNMLLKDLEAKTGEKYLVRDAIHDSYISCYTNVILFEQAPPTKSRDCKYRARHLQWDSVTFEPFTYQEAHGSDITGLFYFDYLSQAALEKQYPDQKKNIKAHWDRAKNADSSLITSLAQMEGDFTSADRDRLRSVVERSEGSMGGPTGLLPVVCHIYPVTHKEDAWVNIFNEDDEQVRPADWSDEKWSKWVEANKDVYDGPYEREATVLWCSVFTTSGLMLSHGKHWFQDGGALPASFWTACMINGRPSGPAVDMVEDTVRNCVAQIEWLDDVRKGHGVLALFREGAIKNLESITEEANKAFGVGIVSKDFNGTVNDAFSQINRDPTSVWKNYADQSRGEMYENTRLNETMQGAAAPRQAAIAKEVEISQALMVNAIYIDNHNRSWETHQNIKLALLPYNYDEYQIVEVFDEDDQEEKMQEINVPVYDAVGEVVDVINDVTKRRYRWKLNPMDDSPTSKARHIEEALVLINGAAGPLLQKDPSGKLFSRFLLAFPNEFLNKAGKAMMEDAEAMQQQQQQAQQQQAMAEAQTEGAKAQADLLRAQKAGINLSITGDQITKNPSLLNQYLQLLQMATASGGQGQEQAQPQEQAVAV